MRKFKIGIDCYATTEERIKKENETVEEMIRSDGERFREGRMWVQLDAEDPLDAMRRLMSILQKVIDSSV